MNPILIELSLKQVIAFWMNRLMFTIFMKNKSNLPSKKKFQKNGF